MSGRGGYEDDGVHSLQLEEEWSAVVSIGSSRLGGVMLNEWSAEDAARCVRGKNPWHWHTWFSKALRGKYSTNFVSSGHVGNARIFECDVVGTPTFDFFAGLWFFNMVTALPKTVVVFLNVLP